MPDQRRYAEIQRQLDIARAAGMSYEAWIESKAGACPPENAGPRAERPGAQTSAGRGAGASDWPMPEPPPYPADDEGQAVPDE